MQQCMCAPGNSPALLHVLAPEAAGLLALWGSLLKAGLWCQPARKVGLSYRAHCALCVCDCFSHCNQLVERGGAPLVFTSNDLSMELFPCLCDSEPCWLEGRSSGGGLTACVGDATPMLRNRDHQLAVQGPAGL